MDICVYMASIYSAYGACIMVCVYTWGVGGMYVHVCIYGMCMTDVDMYIWCMCMVCVVDVDVCIWYVCVFIWYMW